MKPYPAYKDSGYKEMGKMPKHWTAKKLKYSIQIGSGEGISNNELKPEGSIPVYGGNGILGYTEKYNSEIEELIIGRVGALCGNVHLVVGNKWISDNALRLLTSENYRFMYFLLTSMNLNDLSSKTAQPLLTSSLIKNQIVILPEAYEQTQIATFLDHKTKLIDDLITKKEKLIELLKEERTAIINQAVTKGLDPNVKMKDSGVEWLREIPEHWDRIRVTNIGSFSKGGGISKSDLTDEGFQAIIYGDIYTKYEISVNSAVRHTSQEVVNKSVLLNYGDLLMTGSGETAEDIGKCVVFLGEKETYAGGDVIILRPNKGNPLFLSYLLNSEYLVNEKAKLAKGGIIVHIYSSQLRNIGIPFPPVQEQVKIAEYLKINMQSIEESITKIKDEIRLFNEYKSSLINEAVTGKIDVRDYKLN